MSDPNSAQNSITTSSYSAWLQEQQGGVLVATWYSGESEAPNYLHCVNLLMVSLHCYVLEVT